MYTSLTLEEFDKLNHVSLDVYNTPIKLFYDLALMTSVNTIMSNKDWASPGEYLSYLELNNKFTLKEGFGKYIPFSTPNHYRKIFEDYDPMRCSLNAEECEKIIKHVNWTLISTIIPSFFAVTKASMLDLAMELIKSLYLPLTTNQRLKTDHCNDIVVKEIELTGKPNMLEVMGMLRPELSAFKTQKEKITTNVVYSIIEDGKTNMMIQDPFLKRVFTLANIDTDMSKLIYAQLDTI